VPTAPTQKLDCQCSGDQRGQQEQHESPPRPALAVQGLLSRAPSMPATATATPPGALVRPPGRRRCHWKESPTGIWPVTEPASRLRCVGRSVPGSVEAVNSSGRGCSGRSMGRCRVSNSTGGTRPISPCGRRWFVPVAGNGASSGRAARRLRPTPARSAGRPRIALLRRSFSVGGSRRRYFPVAAAAKALLVMYGAPGDRATEMMYATRLHAAVAARGRVGAEARLAAERHDTSA
jgi:hypothetical protein